MPTDTDSTKTDTTPSSPAAGDEHPRVTPGFLARATAGGALMGLRGREGGGKGGGRGMVAAFLLPLYIYSISSLREEVATMRTKCVRAGSSSEN